ncbi:2-dehydropantoate 2-reductase-like protein [Terfezia boudieri ATCC MYA-4762]|uniref:2-dehydropantoate 2-reductase n=1 Tax=Terfezia boudieri ATCC MYA-4762 TaxID=1051890 RepID=A0A3N4MBC5_9PEZI|nr:2-dehydropantoate 2-reductase-like protein [Terfezia boudieri ATCC MYA-4762]
MAKAIHILGVGNIGLLFAHRLAESHGADMVNLLFHRHSLIREWDEADRKIELVSNGIPNAQKGYGFQLLGHPNDHDINPINNLIIATKATNTIAAVRAVRRHLTSQSTVLLCQNGMGITDELEVLFRDVAPEYIPKFMVAIVSHGVFSTSPFRAVHAGNGMVIMGSIGIAPQTDSTSPTVSLSELLCHTPALAAVRVSTLQLVQAQLEKLVVNAIINPLTVLFNCRNGQLFSNSQQADLMHLLLEEICEVLKALPEAQRIPRKEETFSVSRMKEVVMGVADRTGRNTSSMLQDIRSKRTTEIDYINGYVVRKGAELGINCGINERVVGVVKAARLVDMEEILKLFPELSRDLD